MKLGVVSLSLGFMDFPETLRFVGKIGGKTLEISTADGVHNGSLDFSDQGRRALRELVKSEGVSLTSVAGYSDFTLADGVEVNKQLEGIRWYCQLAADLNVKIVRVMGGNPKEGLSKDEMVDNIISGFKRAVEIATEFDVILALENHGMLVNDGPTLVRIVEEVGSPYLRITMDTGNFCWAGNSVDAAYEYFKQVSPYAANVHLKDFVYDNNEVKFVPLGEGLLDFKRIFKTLEDAGYTGSILCEYEGVGDPRVLIKEGVFTQEEIVTDIKNATRRSLEFLQSILEG